ncbi:hypothetical protein [uncultured Alistipes sp.]|uniref:hypothetical protein n=1 Tax=uncultured Alistipes sp. TaxID=538949 RepID=UPI00272BC87C|nr:hypothetical protein [uncultured Alistipes sp.]
MMITHQNPPKPRFVALLNMPYLWGETAFRMEMIKLGIERDASLCTGMPHKAIMASATSYWLDDYADEATLRDAFHFVLTYTVEDFVAAIKTLQEDEK